jgi:regulator of sirC expression with transglutaminase-like and TPR domain
MDPTKDLFRMSAEERYARSNLEAEIALRRASSLNEDPTPPRITALLVRAQAATNAALRNGFGYADLLDLVNEVLRFDPSTARALAMRAVARAGLNQIEAAISDAERALAIDPIAGLEIGINLHGFLRRVKGTTS